MFHKDGSSLGGSNHKKKSMDVPLKKSERRLLRRMADEWFFGVNNNKNTSSTNDDANTDDQHHQAAALLLNQAFLCGNLLQRKVLLPSTGIKVMLYLRTPNTTTHLNDDKDDDKDHSYRWPYTTCPQIIWMSMEDKHNTNTTRQLIHAPTVALLAVMMMMMMMPSPQQQEYDYSFPIVTIAPHVSKYLCRGAHLMRAGMTHVPTTNNNNNATNNIVAICVKGNAQPMAVGRLTDGTCMENIGPNTKGIGVEIYTCYGDDLWHQQQQSQQTTKKDENLHHPIMINPIGGASYDNGHYGNVGFLHGKYVSPIIEVVVAAGVHDKDKQEQQQQGDAEEHTPKNDLDKSAATPALHDNQMTEKKASAKDDDDDVVVVEQHKDDGNEMQQAQQQQQQETADTTDDKQECEDIQETNPHDAVLHQAVCQALVALKKSDLPMTTANFYAQHVVVRRRPQSIQLKQTTWKKLGNYLAEQVERQLLTVGPGKDKTKDPMGCIISVNKGHADLRALRQQQQLNTRDEADNPDKKKKLAIVNLHVVPHHFISLMRLNLDDVQAIHAKSPERQGTSMLTAPEVRSILDDYVTSNELVDSIQPNQVKVDGPLCDALYKKKKQGKQQSSSPHGDSYPTQVSRKELNTTWLARMESAYALVEMPGNRILTLSRGTPPKVSMEISMRQGNKYVTRVRGLEEYGIDANHFSKDVAKRFACSATIETNPRAALKKGHVELVFQGRLDDELRALLLGDERLSSHGGVKGGDYCLPKNVIDVTLKKGVSAKKKKR